ncbi:unnamed protein product [Adineta steineri]|uniref:Uncharacterized protein n=1 Tax=Adineta steineri TaxID=433720 RepID=A0A819NJ76_9BILA|nr:unnamed protein product [Adineta steineri]CAF3999087.1 unnamed protein product [Adineta steineri]
MKRTTTSVQQRKRIKTTENDILIKSNDDSIDLISNENQISFVWIDKNIKQNNRIKTSIKQLKSILPCAIATDNYNGFEQWFMECNGDNIENFQFVFIDITKRLNPQAHAMFKALTAMVKPAIYVFDDISATDFHQLSDKPTYFFVSSTTAAKMKDIPKQTQLTFVLEEDKNKVDHYERFENGEDLIFELGDVIYRCYKKEANQYLASGDTIMADMKEKQANQVHSNLKKAYKSVSHDNDIIQDCK